MADSVEDREAGEPGNTGYLTPETSPAAGQGTWEVSDLVPEWLVNLAALGWRVLVIAALVLVSAYLASILWTVVASIAVAIVVAAVFAPLVLRQREQGRSRGAAAGIAWLAAIATVVGLLALMVLAVLPVAAELFSRIATGVQELQSTLSDAGAPATVSDVAADINEALDGALAETVSGIVASAASVVTILILATFLLFYFLRDGDKAWLWIFQAVSGRKRDRITTAGDEALARVGGYLRSTTIHAGLVAVSDFVFMLVVGVPMALPLAILVFFGGYVPYFGGVVTTAIVLLVALGALGPVPTLILIVLFVIRDVVLRYYGRRSPVRPTVDVHPALVVVAVLAGYELAGIAGLVAAVPVTAFIVTTWDAVKSIIEPDSPPHLPGLVPAWLDRMAQFSWRILIGIGFIALLVLILTTAPLVVLPIVFALILAATLEPLTEILMQRGQTRGRAALVAVTGSFVVVAAVMALSIYSLVESAPELGDTVTSGADSASESVDGNLDLAAEAVATGATAAVETIVHLGQTFGAAVVIAVVSTLLTLYFLRDGERVWNRALSHFRTDVRDDVHAAGSRAFNVLGGYMIGTGLISFVGAGSQFVIMVVLGLPLAMPVFVLSFFLGFIPYIGGFISTLIAFLIAVAVGSTADIVIMFIWTIAFNLVTGNIVAPLVYGKTVHIHPAIVLVAIPAGSAIAGILGMFIVVPALGVVAVSWRTVLRVMSVRKSGTDPEAAVPSEVLPQAEAADSS